MKNLFNNLSLALCIATIGAFVLFIAAQCCGLWIIFIVLAGGTLFETLCIGQDDLPDPLFTIKIHIMGCLIFLALMWLISLPEYEPNLPFNDFHYEAELGHGNYSSETDPAFLWWFLIAIPAVRCVIIHPILLACHRKD